MVITVADSTRRVYMATWVRPMKADDTQLLTLGHGTLGQTELSDLLRAIGVEALVDVRTAPGSRRFPHVARGEMERWLPASGVAYQWEPRLGGWRKPDPSSPNTALRNESFRGYADYMRSAPFWEALDAVLDLAGERRTRRHVLGIRLLALPPPADRRRRFHGARDGRAPHQPQRQPEPAPADRWGPPG